MPERSLVALETDDSYFNDWMMDLFSLERATTAENWNEKMWNGISATYAAVLIRSN